MKTTFTANFDVDEDTFWQEVYFDADLHRRFFVDGLGCTGYEVVRHEGSVAEGLTREVRSSQRVAGPRAVRKLLGDATASMEVGRFESATKTWSFEVSPAALGDRIQITAEATTQTTGEGQTLFRCDLEAVARIPGLSGMIEKFVVKQAGEGFALQERLFREHIAARFRTTRS